MLFSSALFLWLFLPCVAALNFSIKKQYRNYLLLVASLIFYAWGEPKYILLMLLCTVLNWLFGVIIDKVHRTRPFWLFACVISNLSLLGYFKYFNFIVNTINALFGARLLSTREITLPIGISFFTFQALSYVIDLYRGNCKVQKNILHLALYISFFPQLIAGPIVRYSDIDNQIENRSVTLESFSLGLRRFLYGLGKKIIISNCLAELADLVWEIPFESLTTINAWIGTIAYSLQIYYDFSGYSDMAIGLGSMFGFTFLENFNYPYLSKSIQEFWQRWHISLGTWFKEYVYIPLGGNRKGSVRTYINLMLVFFLTGMWHGASWTFVFWGLYHGFFQIIERRGLKKFLNKHAVLSSIYCLLVVAFGWVFFRTERLIDAFRFVLRLIAPWRYELKTMFSASSVLTLRYVVIMILAIIGCGPIQKISSKITMLNKKWKHSYIELVFLGFVFFYCMVLLVAGTYNPFIYFRF